MGKDTMQDRKVKTRSAKRRKAARPNKAALCCYAANAYEMGTAAGKRIFLNVRLSVDRRQLRRIYQVSRFFGYSASDTARQALRFAEAESHAERLAVTKKYEAKGQAMIKEARKGQPKRRHYLRPRLPGKPELWANAETDGLGQLEKNRALFNLTARNLADLAAEAEEMRLSGYREYNGDRGGKVHELPPSVSGAFRRLVARYLTILTGLMKAIRARTDGADPEAIDYEKPARAKRWRTITETKRAIKERGTRSGL